MLLALGVIIGLARSSANSVSDRAIGLVDMGLLVLVGALVGGRAGYVLLNWGYFQLHSGEIPQVWLGGLSGTGAVFGFVLALLLTAWLFAESPLVLAGQLLPLGMSLAVAGWLAAWWAGSTYGAQMDVWYAVPARGESGVWAMRFPTQLLGALFCLGLWAGLDFFAHRFTQTGLRAVLGLLGLGLVLAGLSLTRVDPVPAWRSLRLDTWAALGVICLAVSILVGLEVAHFTYLVRRRLKERSLPPA